MQIVIEIDESARPTIEAAYADLMGYNKMVANPVERVEGEENYQEEVEMPVEDFIKKQFVTRINDTVASHLSRASAAEAQNNFAGKIS